MQKDLKIGELIDVYGTLLTERQREILTSYYDYDLSLSEIAENFGITRQAVRDVIVRAGEQLTDYEYSLGIAERQSKVKDAVENARKLISEKKADEAYKVLSDLQDYLQEN